MIPNTNLGNAPITSDNFVSKKVGFDQSNIGFIFEILRKGIYKDGMLAPIREYITNAWDEHTRAGNTDISILISSPTGLKPEFVVRDFGRGDDRFVMVKVDPANVVCIPYDSGYEKMRVCEYEVVEEVAREKVQPMNDDRFVSPLQNSLEDDFDDSGDDLDDSSDWEQEY
jgi:hypothetical protein